MFRPSPFLPAGCPGHLAASLLNTPALSRLYPPSQQAGRDPALVFFASFCYNSPTDQGGDADEKLDF